MANRFKDYRAQLKINKTVVLSDDELSLYSKTANNEGVSHEHKDWDIVSEETIPEFDEKDRTIKRDLEREQKIKNTLEEDI